jgi:hypothetical protein
MIVLLFSCQMTKRKPVKEPKGKERPKKGKITKKPAVSTDEDNHDESDSVVSCVDGGEDVDSEEDSEYQAILQQALETSAVDAANHSFQQTASIRDSVLALHPVSPIPENRDWDVEISVDEFAERMIDRYLENEARSEARRTARRLEALQYKEDKEMLERRQQQKEATFQLEQEVAETEREQQEAEEQRQREQQEAEQQRQREQQEAEQQRQREQQEAEEQRQRQEAEQQRQREQDRQRQVAEQQRLAARVQVEDGANEESKYLDYEGGQEVDVSGAVTELCQRYNAAKAEMLANQVAAQTLASAIRLQIVTCSTMQRSTMEQRSHADAEYATTLQNIDNARSQLATTPGTEEIAGHEKTLMALGVLLKEKVPRTPIEDLGQKLESLTQAVMQRNDIFQELRTLLERADLIRQRMDLLDAKMAALEETKSRLESNKRELEQL